VLLFASDAVSDEIKVVVMFYPGILSVPPPGHACTVPEVTIANAQLEATLINNGVTLIEKLFADAEPGDTTSVSRLGDTSGNSPWERVGVSYHLRQFRSRLDGPSQGEFMSEVLRAEWRLERKLATLEYAEQWGNVPRACRAFAVSRGAYYRWREVYAELGVEGLKRRKPIAKDHPRRIPETTIAKVLELRQSYRLGPQRIVWYLERYHGIRIAFSSVYRILVRNGVRRLPNKSDRRALHTHRYAKLVPGHQVQMDVKIVSIPTAEGSSVRRYQYTAVDDATRIRALMIYPAHTQKNAIAFFDYVVERFPFRIHTIRTDRGHE